MCEFGVIGIYVLIFLVIPRVAVEVWLLWESLMPVFKVFWYIGASIEYETSVFTVIY